MTCMPNVRRATITPEHLMFPFGFPDIDAMESNLGTTRARIRFAVANRHRDPSERRIAREQIAYLRVTLAQIDAGRRGLWRADTNA